MKLTSIAMRDALLEKIWVGMGKDNSIFFLSADFGSPVLDKIRSDFPERFINVGIAEQNLINISAGLALEGFKVFAYAIAPFITMRCFEQIRVNLALLSKLRNMNVNLIGVGAGYSYVVSGPTHQCYEDITLMRALPNFQFYSPCDHISAAGLYEACVNNLGPKYLRLDAQVLPVIYSKTHPDFESGFNLLEIGNDVCIIATGYMVHTALIVAKNLKLLGVQAGVIDLFDIANFNHSIFESIISGYKNIVSLEEGFSGRGGIDSMLFNLIANSALDVSLLNLGVEGDYRFELGLRNQLHEDVGIGPDIAQKKILNFLNINRFREPT